MNPAHGLGPFACVVSAPMRQVLDLVNLVSKQDFPVLILGECGTGKELVARWIHSLGCRRSGPFVPLDCASLSPGLVETELFGHAKGAFTGAVQDKRGLFESANRGTLFLDEIGELPLSMQMKFLRALQEREIRPVGAVRTVPVNARIVAATNRNLESMVREGGFRQDLFFRLNIVQISLPPLRERKGAIPALVQAFIDKHRGPESPTGVSEAGMQYLQACDWPGNIRELENAVIRGLSFASGELLEPFDFDLPFPSLGTPIPARTLRTMRELEDDAIAGALRETKGNKDGAARLLGIGKTTLYRKLKTKAAIAGG